MSVDEKVNLLNRLNHLSSRCFNGFDRRDQEKKNPIPEEKALEEWKELLEKRFPQPRGGGNSFVLKIAKVVKDKKTDEGLYLTGKDAILEHLAKWCKRMCQEHNIDPGSQAMQALQQQAHWHEESMEAHATTHANQEATHSLLTQVATAVGVRDRLSPPTAAENNQTADLARAAAKKAKSEKEDLKAGVGSVVRLRSNPTVRYKVLGVSRCEDHLAGDSFKLVELDASEQPKPYAPPPSGVAAAALAPSQQPQPQQAPRAGVENRIFV
jgi:hypothetical protein